MRAGRGGRASVFHDLVVGYVSIRCFSGLVLIIQLAVGAAINVALGTGVAE
jgi:hypothetical protein